jgi:hypothetical protein
MIEDKGDKESQSVEIMPMKDLKTTLYRMALEEKDFLPFFNNSHDSPEGLRKFCDYILLAEHRKRNHEVCTFVLLIELKRGKNGTAAKQLNASQTFMEYIYSSAERLHVDFNDSEFDKEKVTTMKIVIQKPISNKKRTREDERKNVNNSDVKYFETMRVFPIKQFIENRF